MQYIIRLVNATRKHPQLLQGASPRATLAVTGLSRAVAFLRARDYVVPEDVQDVFLPVCSHRLMLNVKARMAQMDAGQILQEILKSVPVPKAL